MTEEVGTTEELGSDEEFEAILDFLKTNRGFDFTGYKRPSLRRRIERRMQVVSVPTFAEYLEYLKRHESEFEDLFNTILINVTSFFRDPPAWEALSRDVIPAIVDAERPEHTIRLWSAGCATGEEAYTLAILLAEALGLDGYLDRVKLYATDADEEALTKGRHARYSREDVEGVSDEYLARYFDEVSGGYAVKPELRRAVIFGRNDLITDPPISRVDLILARNTLMYFNAETQRRILRNFHFALKPDGYLFLGKSELLLTRSDLFAPLDMKRRIFRRVQGADFGEGLRRIARGRQADEQRLTDEARISQASFEAAPIAQLIVDQRGVLAAANVQARNLFGLTQKDLGRPFQDLEVSYRPIDLRSLIDEVRAQRHARSIRDVEWPLGSDVRHFDVQAGALHASDGSEVGMTIAFLDTTRYRRLQENLEHSKERLETAYEELQSTAEELETTNEELQSTNEELETTNEELHSTNEELETMNEELQSTNEELTTMNDELRERTDDLHQVNAFLESILGSLGPAVAVTDSELRIEAWNDRARDLWGLSAEEVRGHHLMNLDIGLPLDRVLPVVRGAIAAGDGRQDIVVEATNRRGRQIRCHVIAAPLMNDGEASGVILLMEEEEAEN